MKYLGSHKGHINDGYVGSGLRFQSAVSKYGIENFDRIIVDFCYSEAEIKQKEQFYLNLYECAKSGDFYNISYSSTGGNLGQDYSKTGIKASKTFKARDDYQEVREKINKSVAESGVYERNSKRFILNNPNSGGDARREYNKKYGSPNIGYKHTEENKKLFSESKLGDKNPNKEGLVGRLETWLQDPATNEVLKYDSLSKAEKEHNANHQSVWLHRKNRRRPYRGYFWYVGDEINQILN